MELTDTKRRWVWIALAALVCGWLYVAGTDRYGLFDVDEAIFTQATREMLANASREPLPGAELTAAAMPTYNGEPRYHKPPLIYWVQAGMMQIFGEDSLWAARLPSGLSALACIGLLGWWVGWMTGNRRWGLLAAAVLGLNLSFLVIGRAATADGVLNLFSLAVALSVLTQLYGAPRNRLAGWWPVISGVLATFALLAKGPVALVPAAMVAMAALLGRPAAERGALWRQLNPWLVGSVAAAGLVPWLLLMIHQSGGDFFYEFIYVHNIQRFTGGFNNTQSSSPLYYLGVLMVGFLPWVLFAPRAFWWALRNVRTRLASPRIGTALPALAAVWAVGYIVLFSFSQTKLAHYIVPAYPALAIVVAGWLHERMQKNGKRPEEGIVGVLGAVWLVLLGAFLLSVNPILEGLRAPELTGALGWLQSLIGFDWPPHDGLTRAVLQQPVALDPAVGFAGLVMLIAVVPAYLLFWQERPRRSGLPLAVMAFSWALVLGLVAWGVVPTVWRYTQAPLVELAAGIRAAPPGIPVIHLGVHKPSVLYLSQRPFWKLERPLQLPDYLTAPKTLVLTELPTVAAIRQEIGVLQNPGARIARQHCTGGYCLLLIERAGR